MKRVGHVALISDAWRFATEVWTVKGHRDVS